MVEPSAWLQYGIFAELVLGCVREYQPWAFLLANIPVAVLCLSYPPSHDLYSPIHAYFVVRCMHHL